MPHALSIISKAEPSITLAVWGLAFKARTDDIREAPAIRCIEKFLSAGFKVKAYDPEAMPATNAALNGKIETMADSYAVMDGADALVVFTDWQEFRAPDFDLIGQKLRAKVIFDGRNLYEPSWLRKARVYVYQCWKAMKIMHQSISYRSSGVYWLALVRTAAF